MIFRQLDTKNSSTFLTTFICNRKVKMAVYLFYRYKLLDVRACHQDSKPVSRKIGKQLVFFLFASTYARDFACTADSQVVHCKCKATPRYRSYTESV